jgi:hypothetical protein
MKKNDRVSAYVSTLGLPDEIEVDPFYAGYFVCFNAREYYEAHDVLEHLWLQCRDENRLFYQGLIQIAGAFVHLQKQHLRPDHPKDGRRMRPAVRLFHLGMRNIEPYGPVHLRLDVAALCAMCSKAASEILASDFRKNPWNPARPPQVHLLPA